jgi:hypothetical protein
MSTLRFFSRVAFICNLCFLAAVFLLWMDHPPAGEMISMIIVIGVAMAFIINLIVNIWYGIHLFMQRQRRDDIPKWLMIANFLFLIPELILLLK